MDANIPKIMITPAAAGGRQKFSRPILTDGYLEERQRQKQGGQEVRQSFDKRSKVDQVSDSNSSMVESNFTNSELGGESGSQRADNINQQPRGQATIFNYNPIGSGFDALKKAETAFFDKKEVGARPSSSSQKRLKLQQQEAAATAALADNSAGEPLLLKSEELPFDQNKKQRTLKVIKKPKLKKEVPLVTTINEEGHKDDMTSKVADSSQRVHQRPQSALKRHQIPNALAIKQVSYNTTTVEESKDAAQPQLAAAKRLPPSTLPTEGTPPRKQLQSRRPTPPVASQQNDYLSNRRDQSCERDSTVDFSSLTDHNKKCNKGLMQMRGVGPAAQTVADKRKLLQKVKSLTFGDLAEANAVSLLRNQQQRSSNRDAEDPADTLNLALTTSPQTGLGGSSSSPNMVKQEAVTAKYVTENVPSQSDQPALLKLKNGGGAKKLSDGLLALEDDAESGQALRQDDQSDLAELNTPALPPLLSKLTFCELTEQTHEMSEQISLASQRNRGAQTPVASTTLAGTNGRRLSQVQVDSLDTRSMQAEPRGLATSSGQKMVLQGRDSQLGKGKRNRHKHDFATRNDGTVGRSKNNTNQISAENMNLLGYEDCAREPISAKTSDQGPLFNSRSASFLAMQSHLRDFAPGGADAETLSYYDRFFQQSQHQENNSSWAKLEDGTPKNATVAAATGSNNFGHVFGNSGAKGGGFQHFVHRAATTTNKALSSSQKHSVGEAKAQRYQKTCTVTTTGLKRRRPRLIQSSSKGGRTATHSSSKSHHSSSGAATIISRGLVSRSRDRSCKLRKTLSSGAEVMTPPMSDHHTNNFIIRQPITQQVDSQPQSYQVQPGAAGPSRYQMPKRVAHSSQKASEKSSAKTLHQIFTLSEDALLQPAANQHLATSNPNIINESTTNLGISGAHPYTHQVNRPPLGPTTTVKKAANLSNSGASTSVFQWNTHNTNNGPIWSNNSSPSPGGMIVRTLTATDQLLTAQQLQTRARHGGLLVDSHESGGRGGELRVRLQYAKQKTQPEIARLKPLSASKFSGCGVQGQQRHLIVNFQSPKKIKPGEASSLQYSGKPQAEAKHDLGRSKISCNVSGVQLSTQPQPDQFGAANSARVVTYFGSGTQANHSGFLTSTGCAGPSKKGYLEVIRRRATSATPLPGRNTVRPVRRLDGPQQPALRGEASPQGAATGASPGDNNQTKTDLEWRVRETKRRYNDMKEKNGKLQSRIGFLQKEVAERDKLMQTFILNNEPEANVKQKCLLQSYKSKVAEFGLKLEALQMQNTALMGDKARQAEANALLESQLAQITAEKDLLHGECVKMSQHIYITTHEQRRRQPIITQALATQDHNSQTNVDQNSPILLAAQLEGEPGREGTFFHPMSTEQRHQQQSSRQRQDRSAEGLEAGTEIINIETTNGRCHRTPPVQQRADERTSETGNELQIADESQEHEQPSAEVLERIAQQKAQEKKRTVEQFHHIKACPDGCSIEHLSQQCARAKDLYPRYLPHADLQLLEQSNSLPHQKAILVRIVKESHQEVQNLRLMLLQELHEKLQLAAQVRQPVQDEVKSEDEAVSEAAALQCETQDLISARDNRVDGDQDDASRSESAAARDEATAEQEKARKIQFYLSELRERVVEHETTIRTFKREIQRLYAPKVKIALQIMTLQDEGLWSIKATKSADPRANVDRAKDLLKGMFHLGEQVLDDSFFKTFMRSFEPVFAHELSSMTLKVMEALKKAQQRNKRKSSSPSRQRSPSKPEEDEHRLSTVHKVIRVEDLQLRGDPKLLQYAKYLAHQTLNSEDKLSVEITDSTGSYQHQDSSNCFSLQECVRQLATQRSTQESDLIDQTQMGKLLLKMYESQAFDVFFESIASDSSRKLQAAAEGHKQVKTKSGESPDSAAKIKPLQLPISARADETSDTEYRGPSSLIDCHTFGSILRRFASGVDEERACDQLQSLLTVRTMGAHLVDLTELRKLMSPSTNCSAPVTTVKGAQAIATEKSIPLDYRPPGHESSAL